MRGGARRRRLDGAGRPTVMAARRGGALARGGGDGWAQKLHGDEGVPFPGSARGVDGRSRELHGELRLCSPAMVWARAGLGLCPFIVAGGGRGFPGGSTAGESANWGSSAGGGAWLKSSAMAVAVASSQMAGARGELRWCQEGAVLGKPGEHEVVWAWGSAPVRPGGRRRHTASPVDGVQGGGRLKNRPVAIS